MKVQPPAIDAGSLAVEKEFERFIIEQATPRRITHHIIIIPGRKGSPKRFNLEWLPKADPMARLIVNGFDEAIYCKRKVPENQRYPYILKGETIASATHAEAHLHWHMLADLSDPTLAARVLACRPRFAKRLKAGFLRMGHHIRIEYVEVGAEPADHQREAEYIAKCADLDAERYYRR